MLDLGEFRKTPLYQSILEQTRQEMQPEIIELLLDLGLSVQAIADRLSVDVEIVRQIARAKQQL
ncbi:MAG: hypothetical protein AB4290_26070 [Spirulina sp.]